MYLNVFSPSQLVSNAGEALLPFEDSLISVIKNTIHLKCKEASEIGHKTLSHLLKSLTSTHLIDLRSPVQQRKDKPLTENLPIRDWFCLYYPEDFEARWHNSSVDEKRFAEKLLRLFLLPELERIKCHCDESASLSRYV
jgi:hypothetical protein